MLLKFLFRSQRKLKWNLNLNATTNVILKSYVSFIKLYANKISKLRIATQNRKWISDKQNSNTTHSLKEYD